MTKVADLQAKYTSESQLNAYAANNGFTAHLENYSKKTAPVFNVKGYDAAGDGITDDSGDIQSAIDACYAAGGGIVFFPAGTYLIGTTLRLPSKVILVGDGSSSSILKAKSGLNGDVIKSTNYETLTGTDTWLVANGNNYAFGLKHLKIDGNKSNQTSGNGVSLYGKRVYIDNVIITSCKNEGWHSESNETIPGAPDASGNDFPEGLIRGLYVWQCDGNGFAFRGQHDTVIESLFVGVCGGWGARFETSAVGNYNASCDVKFMHIYANTSGGVYVNASIRCAYMISESNYGEGLELVPGGADQAQFGIVQLYYNCRTTGTYNAVIAAQKVTVNQMQVRDAGASKSGLSITGGFNNIGEFQATGSASTGTALTVQGAYNRVRGTVDGYNGVGGKGLLTGSGAQLLNSVLELSLNNCATLWQNASTGSNNRYRIDGYAAAGQTFFTGSGPNATDSNEIWDVNGSDSSGNLYLSEIRKTSSNVDLNTTTEQTITVGCSELLGLTIEPEDVTFGLYYTGTNTVFEVAYLRLSAISSTQLTFKVRMRVAAGSAAAANIVVQARL
jgi:hypothetical protein